MIKFENLDYLNKDINIIKCPICGHEYLPAEIFLPIDLLGKPTDITKNEVGRIQFHFGENPTYEEEYCCDSCGTLFNVKAKVAYESYVLPEHNFTSGYTTVIPHNEIDLFTNDNNTENK